MKATLVLRMLRGSHIAALAAGAALAFAAPAGATAAKPVPSLQPQATAKLWHRLVQRRHTQARTADCMRLASSTRRPTGCASRRSSPRTRRRARSTTSRSRRSPPTRRPFAPTSRGGFARSGRTSTPSPRSATTAGARGSRRTGARWYAAGVEARKRMAAQGFDVAAGDIVGRQRILVGRAHRHGRGAPEPP